MVIVTWSPWRRVRSGGGTIEVPVRSTAPSGRSWPRQSQSTSSGRLRFMSATEQLSRNRTAPSRSMDRPISMAAGSGASPTGTRQGPRAQLPAYSLAWGRYRGVLALDGTRRHVVADGVGDDLAAPVGDQGQLRFGHVPVGVGPHADRPARAPGRG